MNKLVRFLSPCLFAGLVIALVVSSGCAGQKPPAPGIDLAITQVPNLELDAYVYFKQAAPTKIPGNLIAQADLAVESLAVWGVVADDQFTIGGALVLASAAEAARVQGQIPAQAGVWSSLSDRTIYFVRGAGAAAEKLKAAISKKDFKNYNEADSLAAAARLPNGGNSKLAAIAVVKPSQPVVKLIASYSGQKIADMIGALALVKLEPIVVGIYAPGQIDVADIAQRANAGTIWEADLGVLALVKSGLPGAVVSPIASKFLENAGYTATEVGGLTVYKGALEVRSGLTVPVLINLDGNSLSVASSGKESYAQTLMAGLKK